MLPPLREELTVHIGPTGHDGAPTWTLHDPLRNVFFRLSWPAFEILSHWGLGEAEAVAEAVGGSTTLEVTAEDVLDVAEFFAKNQLLTAVAPTDTRRLLAIAQAARTGWFAWLLHHYLFFRIPLVRPDALLNRVLPYVRWLGGGTFRLSTLAALIAGLFLVSRQWEVFTATLVDHFSLTGLAAFGVALGTAKIIHELGHALTAKAFGCRVPTMGLAFLVMMPVLYTDVNETWFLPERRQRVLIGAAGILSELALAAWATLAWAVLPEGTPRSMAFTLAATTWLTSVVINLSPFMRFDGYFLLMDALDTPNLHPRSFALARWWLRETLFQLGEASPEPLPPRRRALFIAFAFAVWIYRLSLFLGIALLVYHFFIKVVGVLLFAVEIGWFVVMPFVLEFKQWWARRQTIMAGHRTRFTLGGVAVVLSLLIIPWSTQVKAPAVLKAARHEAIYAPAPALVEAVEVADGQTVRAGQVLVRLATPEQDYRLGRSERRIAALRYQLEAASFEDSFRGRSQSLARDLDAAQAELAALTAEKARHLLVAPFDGVVSDLAPQTNPGQWIGVREPLLAVRDGGGAIDAYMAEDDLPRVGVGDRARFLPEDGSVSLPATVKAIDRAAVRSLSDPALATPFGGALAARMTKQALVPDQAVYRLRLAVDIPVAVPVVLRGEVIVSGHRESLLARVLRSGVIVLMREWGA